MVFTWHWRVFARVVVVCLVGSCASGVTARSVANLELATRGAPDTHPQSSATRAPNGPFGLADAKDSPLAIRWRDMQAALALEAHILSVCEGNRAICPPAAARFLTVVEAARGREGRARLGEVNRAVNLAIRPESDRAQYGLEDLWATPLMTFASGAGDCEDYAIAKYVALRTAGIPDADLRLVIMHDDQLGQDHAVVAARLENRWLVLDNRTMLLRADTEMQNVTPLLALDSGGADPAPVEVASAKPAAAVATATR